MSSWHHSESGFLPVSFRIRSPQQEANSRFFPAIGWKDSGQRGFSEWNPQNHLSSIKPLGLKMGNNHSTWKWMVGRLLSFWETTFILGRRTVSFRFSKLPTTTGWKDFWAINRKIKGPNCISTNDLTWWHFEATWSTTCWHQVGGCHHPRSCLECRRPSTQRWSSAWSARWSALESFVLISFNLHHCCDHFWRRSDLRGMRREACFLFPVFPLLFLKRRDDAMMIFSMLMGQGYAPMIPYWTNWTGISWQKTQRTVDFLQNNRGE